MREKLLKKWLNNELTAEELKSFKNTSDYKSYAKILERAEHFKAPEFDEEQSLKSIDFAIKSRKKSSNKTIIQLVASIAAVLLIGFIIIKISYSSLDDYTVQTSIADTKQIELPDLSEVKLNANSTISYDASKWETERQLDLDGEAVFEVEKGEQFTVNTKYGDVKVLGTIFNVKSREYIFEVTCFEGSVSVSINDASYVLKPNDNLILENSNVILDETKSTTPDWTKGLSIIKSKSLEFVLNDLENYYNIQFDTSNIDTSEIYTGSFTHDNLEIALNSITLPLGLSYKINGETVLLSNK